VIVVYIQIHGVWGEEVYFVASALLLGRVDPQEAKHPTSVDF